MGEYKNIQEMISKEICNSLCLKFDDIFLEGLKRKGHEFKNIFEAEVFVKKNCTCKDYRDREERIFYVNKVHFLFHSYKTHIHNPDLSSENFTIKADYGSYSFL